MDIQDERRRLLDAEGGDPTGLMSEQDAYLRSVSSTTADHFRGFTYHLNIQSYLDHADYVSDL